MKVLIAAVVALVLAGAFSVSAQDSHDDDHPTVTRFKIMSTQIVSGGLMSVVRDTTLPNRPCFYLFQSTYSTAMALTPGGAC